jgi:hypothetical protein
MRSKSFLSEKFDIKYLGEADVILNIKLIKDESGITLSQSHSALTQAARQKNIR